MSEKLSRRKFLKNSLTVSAGAGLAFSFEERNLYARSTPEKKEVLPEKAGTDFPSGKIKDVTISRLMVGGNLTSGFAHSRDLIYVSPLLNNYFTDAKIFETWQLCEENGINTAILRLDNKVLGLLNEYWHQQGGKLQWIAQVKPKEDDLATDILKAIDNGATGVYIQGGVGDRFFLTGKTELIGKALEIIKRNDVIAGIGAHLLDVVVACEKAGFDPDFYMKTLNSANYWTAGPRLEKDDNWQPSDDQMVQPEFNPRTHDNIWATSPQQTIDFMNKVNKPWIAFKVLGAGAIHPKEGFRYAFENGADFICVGMFDFQVREDVVLAEQVLNSGMQRRRAWLG